MAFRLAMVGCLKPCEGPWTTAKGNESGIEIIHLLEGERVELELLADGATHISTYDRPGSFLLPQVKFERYRVNKKANEGAVPAPTIVRVRLNGIA